MTASRRQGTASARVNSEGWLACSREQQGLWLLDEVRDVGAANNVVVGIDLEGELDFGALQQALDALVCRHEAFRTDLGVRDGRLVRRVRSIAGLPAEALHRSVVHDLRAATDELATAPIDALQWPPYRVGLLSERRGRHIVLFVCHHCVVDGLSATPLVTEFATLYANALEGGRARGVDQALPYAEHVAAEATSMLELEDRARAHWEPVLAALPDSLRIPEDGAATGRAGVVDFSIERDLADRLTELGSQHGASLFIVLLATLQLLQHRYAGSGDEAVATAAAMNTRPRGRTDLIGMYANEAPLLTRIDEKRGFAEHLAAVNRGAQELFKLRRFPFTEALARFGGSHGAPDAPVQVGVTYARLGAVSLEVPGLQVTPRLLLPNAGARRPVMLWLFDRPHLLRGRLEYDLGVMTSELASGFARHYVELLSAVVADPERPVGTLDVLTPEERRNVVAAWNATRVERTPTTVHGMVEHQAARTPVALAVHFGEETLTYEALNQRANQLAHYLRRIGVRPDTAVGICLQRTPALVVGLLGILKAGGAYLPLDPEYPTERLRAILDDARAPVLVTEEARVPALARARAKIVLVDRHASSIRRQDARDPDPAADPESLAYVIFTSGSTGVPKGVAMPHRSVANLLQWQASAFAQRGPRVTLQFASVGFDVAFQEIFSTLVTGGSLELISEDTRRDPRELASVIAEAGVQRMFLPFLALNTLAPRLSDVCDRCGQLEVITAGEQLEITPSIRRLWSQRPDWTLENQYGPTESHVVTAHRLRGPADAWPRLPSIGRPIDNARIYILDHSLRPVPPGVPGELWIGGVPVARGYLNQRRLTSERFLADPFGDAGSRIYRSGDLARWTHYGNIEFLGRIDEQVKIRGHRVEPAEIRSTLAESDDVRDVAVIARKGASGLQQLIAYVVPEEGAAPTPHALRTRVAAALPEYMVPSAIVIVDALPLTRNGKLDRRALPAPSSPIAGTREYVAPRTEIERRLAEIWSETLAVDRIGAHDNFFELGGDSLLAAEVVTSVAEAFQRDVPTRLLFARPTVAAFAMDIAVAPRAAPGHARIPPTKRRRLADVVSDEP